ncbi:MAG TPA: chemotaxis protein CheA [Candidatus Thermoplasmatota archaeon]|nr:chemotaxis protein CheA [Candidatus Thermoplasmatota archaeon]
MSDEDSEYKEMFIEEAREHLTTLNQSLLVFEQNPEDEDAMNKIFRAAHTIKGMAATLNYDPIQHLSHKTEDTLDLIRQHQINVDGSVVDLIFDCFDGIEAMVEDIAVNDATDFEVTPLIDQLEQYLESTTDKKDQPKSKKPTSSTSVSLDFPKKTNETILQKLEQDQHVYGLHISVEEQCKMKSIRAYLLLKKLTDNGEIVYSKPSRKKIEEGDFDQSFDLFYTTKAEAEAVHEIVDSVSEIEEKQVVPLTIKDDKITLPKEFAQDQPAKKPEKQDKKQPKTKSTSKKPTKPKKGSQGQSQSIRVSMDQLDEFMNLIGELVISKGRLTQIASDHNLDDLTETISTFDRLANQLQDKIMNIRMIPMKHIFNRFPRMIRDLSKQSSKQIDFQMEGEGIELDRTILDEIGDPLVHLLRNAIDHGVETPEEREKNGKSPSGTVQLIAERKRNHVLIKVTDDGKGIDPQKMREAAVKKGLRTEQEVQSLTDQQALQLIFLPGLSSAEKITNISGRGVGMDVVKSTIEKLNGVVDVQSSMNEGSSFSLKLPLTMAIFKALFVGIDEETYAVPISNIIETVKLYSKDFRFVDGKPTTVIRNEVLPVVGLRNLVKKTDTEDSTGSMYGVIIQREDKKFGLLVDRLIGEQEITIKNVGGSMKRTKGIAGVTITGDGRVILVLDVNTLVN